MTWPMLIVTVTMHWLSE